MFRLKRLKIPILISASMSALILSACAPVGNTAPGSENSGGGVVVSTDLPSPTPNKTKAAKATKEHLESLPKWERDRAQMLLDRRAAQELRLNAKEQAVQWIQWAKPKCEDWFGKGSCTPMAIEIEPWTVCGWAPVRRVLDIDNLEPKQHYLVFLTSPERGITGENIWVASYAHQAYDSKPILNSAEDIQLCWYDNADSIQMPSEPEGAFIVSSP